MTFPRPARELGLFRNGYAQRFSDVSTRNNFSLSLEFFSLTEQEMSDVFQSELYTLVWGQV